MPKYKLPNGKTIFSETELTPDELDEIASEGESTPEFEPLQGISLNKTTDAPVVPEVPVVEPVVEEQGFIDKVLSTANAPMVTLPSQGARQMSGYADQLSEKVGSPAFTSIMKALSGVNEFVGDTASSLTSPINVAMIAATGGSSLAARTALPAIARALGMAGKGLSGAVTAAGGYNLANADSVPEGLAAILELVGGGFGMKQKLPAKGNLGKIADDVVAPPPVIPDEIIPEQVVPLPISEKTSIFGEHTTTKENAEAIRKAGFKPNIKGMGQNYGPGVYVSLDDATTKMYSHPDLETIKVVADVKPFEVIANSSRDADPIAWVEKHQESIHGPWKGMGERPETNRVRERGYAIDAADKTGETTNGRALAMQEYFMKEGHNAITIKQAPGMLDDDVGGNQLLVFDYDKVKAKLPETPYAKPEYPVVESKNPHPVNLIRDDKPGLILDQKRGVFVNKATGEEISLNDPRLNPSYGKPIEKLDPRLEQSAMYFDRPLPSEMPFEKVPEVAQTSMYFGGKKPPDRLFDRLSDKLEQPEFEPTRLSPKTSVFKEGASSIKAVMSAIDLPPFRQGLPAIFTKGWWTSWDDMLKSYGSQKAFDAVQESITSDPLYRNYKAAGGAFTDQITNKEDQWSSALLKKNVPGTNFNPLRGGQRGSIAFLNKLRFDNFKGMYNHARNAAMQPGLTAAQKIESNPATNDVLAKKFADFVNDASGRGSLNFSKNNPDGLVNLEKISDYLNAGLWSPHLISSRVRLFKRYLDPRSYTTAPPEIRRETLKSLLGVVGAWGTTAGLASQIPGVEVSMDSNSSDFGVVKIGDFRSDFSGAFKPYIVLASRFASGLSTSTTNNETKELGKGYAAQTRESILEQFGVNKTSPLVNFAYDLLNASEGRPVNVGDRVLQMAMPMMLEDLAAIAQEDPKLIPMILPALFGTSSQVYNAKSSKEGKIIPKKYDWQFKGGSVFRR